MSGSKSTAGTERARRRALVGAASRWGTAEEARRARAALTTLSAIEGLQRLREPVSEDDHRRLSAAFAAIEVDAKTP